MPIRLPSSLSRPARQRLIAAALLVMVAASPAAATRMMSWNTLNFPGPSGPSREDDFRAVIGATAPDLLVCMELQNVTGAQQFFNNVLNVAEPGQWTLATFTSSNDTERGLYYKASRFSEIAHGQLLTALRTIEWWRMRPVGYSSPTADLYVFVVHLKASQGSDNEAKRLAEVQILRNHLETLPVGANIVVAGDFNIYDSGEPAWAELTGSQANNAGQLFDPINRVGNWHNLSSFADIHTQSTRTTSLGDGGATGGMDDRFDFVLANDDMLDDESLDLRESTYDAYGQDGLHFNLNVNDPPTNAAVGQVMANHLQAASDHLPVIVDLQLPAILSLSGSLDFGDILLGTVVQGTINVANLASANSDELDAAFSSTANFIPIPASVQVAAGGNLDVNVLVNTSVEGVVQENLQVTSDSADSSARTIPASMRVVGASSASFDPSASVVARDLDFGEHTIGEFVPGTVAVFNAAAGGVPAAAEIYDAQVSGVAAARFAAQGFVPTLVGASPDSATVSVTFDDTGAQEGIIYEATLTLSVRDDPAVLGGQLRPDLVVALSATTALTGTPAPDTPIFMTRLLPNVPNPFNPRTSLRYELRQAGSARLEIFDLRGRRIRTLVDKMQREGSHSVVWQGRDDRGQNVASGAYIVRLSAGSEVFTRRIGLLR